jgi:hypothetical protein
VEAELRMLFLIRGSGKADPLRFAADNGYPNRPVPQLSCLASGVHSITLSPYLFSLDNHDVDRVRWNFFVPNVPEVFASLAD